MPQFSSLQSYTNETSPTLSQLRKLVSIIDVHNSVPIQLYFESAQKMVDNYAINSIIYSKNNDLTRQYVDLKTFIGTGIAITRHNGFNLKTNSKLQYSLKTEMAKHMTLLEDLVTRILASDNEERLNEELYEMFDGDAEVVPKPSTCISEQPPTNLTLSDLSISTGDDPVALPQRTALDRPPPHNFDLLRHRSPVSDVSPAIALTAYPNLHPVPSAPPLPPPLRSSSISVVSSGTVPIAAESRILQRIADINSIFELNALSALGSLPSAYISHFELKIGTGTSRTSSSETFLPTRSYYFYKDDYHVSFIPFLRFLSPDLQVSRQALETNRCFFIHLGIAVGMHPFALQTALRYMAAELLRAPGSALTDETPAMDIVPTLIEYAGFVDANCLCYLWPDEFRNKRICIISNTSTSRPMFSCFSAINVPDADLEADIIIHCDGSHFTLLRPLKHDGHSVLSQLLLEAAQYKCIVQNFRCQNLLKDCNSFRRVLEKCLRS